MPITLKILDRKQATTSIDLSKKTVTQIERQLMPLLFHLQEAELWRTFNQQQFFCFSFARTSCDAKGPMGQD